jgi:hypothetical protein
VRIIDVAAFLLTFCVILPAAAGPAVNGTVLETMDSGGYTYMRLKLTNGGETWAAVRETKVTKGQAVSVIDAMTMTGFESKTLHRTFDTILFGSLASAAPAAKAADTANPHAGIGSSDAAHVTVAKATGPDAKTIADLYAQKSTLAGKTVVVRGKVVKYTAGVMGKNWVHLRDGSSGPTDDVTVTTASETALGQTITARGKVSVNRDFGMGYRYAVLIEDATLAP